MDALYALDGLIQWHGGALRTRRVAFRRAVPLHRRQVRRTRLHREKLRYVPNFFESADDAPVAADAVAALRQARGRHILYFGRLSPEKGVDVLIDAAAAANAPLTIVGDGPQRAALEAQARALGARCVFTGRLNGAALWAEVEAATAVALPSVWYEIAPKSVLEAQARGKPVIATRIGGLPELVEDGENRAARRARRSRRPGRRRCAACWPWTKGRSLRWAPRAASRRRRASRAIATTAK